MIIKIIIMMFKDMVNLRNYMIIKMFIDFISSYMFDVNSSLNLDIHFSNLLRLIIELI